MAEIDIVVVNYRTPDDLDRFLRTLRANCADVDYTRTVVNVCETKDDGEVTVDHYLRNEDVISTDQNIGYGRAANMGAALGDAPIVAVFNADVAFTPGVLRNIVDAMQANEDWHIVGPRQVDSLGRITNAGIEGTNKEPKFRAWRTQEDFSDTVDCLSVLGSAYFVRREIWTILACCQTYRDWLELAVAPDGTSLGAGPPGALLPTPLYYEEMWTSLHARAHGMRVVYYGGATLIHEWHRSIRTHLTDEAADMLFMTSRDIFRSCCRHHGIECE